MYLMGMKKDQKKKEGKKGEGRTKTRQALGEVGKWLFLFVILDRIGQASAQQQKDSRGRGSNEMQGGSKRTQMTELTHTQWDELRQLRDTGVRRQ